MMSRLHRAYPLTMNFRSRTSKLSHRGVNPTFRQLDELVFGVLFVRKSVGKVDRLATIGVLLLYLCSAMRRPKL